MIAPPTLSPSNLFLVDSHCHLDFPELAAHMPDVLGRAHAAGVQTLLSIGTRPAGWRSILRIAETHPSVYATIGLHPTDVAESPPSLEAELDAYAAHPRVVGFGETGLDFYHENFDQEAQEQAFRTHIQASLAHDLPLVVHTRHADARTLDLLREGAAAGPLRGVLHCFSGGWDLAKAALDLGFLISFSGIITFKNAESLRQVAAQVPSDRLLVETDSPYLAPTPFRGKVNEPSYVVHTAQEMARLKGLSLEDIAALTTTNFFNLFTKAVRPS